MPSTRHSRAPARGNAHDDLSLDQLRAISLDATGSSSSIDRKRIVSSVFRLLQSERGSRFSECLRHLGANVEILTDKKSRNAALNLIKDGLHHHDEGFLQPLAADYVRVLKAFLGSSPHAEHLATDQWVELVRLCQEGLTKCIEPQSLASQELAVRNGSVHSFSSASQSGTPASTSRSASSARRAGAPLASTPPANPGMLDDLLICLSQLFSVPHAPLLEYARTSLESLFDFLTLTRPLSNVDGQRAAFRCIASTLALSITEDIELCLYIVRNAVPHIRRLFSAKSNLLLREQMLVVLVYAEGFLRRLTLEPDDAGTCAELHRLAQSFRSDYLSRSERSMLKIDDLSFARRDRLAPLSYEALAFRSGDDRVEQAWCVLRTVAIIGHRVPASPESNGLGTFGAGSLNPPRKRRRVEHESLSRMLIESVTRVKGQELLATLHLLVLTILESPDYSDDTPAALDAILTLISSEDMDIANWAMVIVACITCHKSAEASKNALGTTWEKMWSAGMRVMTKTATSRAACHMMALLLEKQLLSFSDVLNDIESIFSAVDLNGPAVFADSSVRLLVNVSRIRTRQKPATILETSKKLLQWLFSRWKPGEHISVVGDPPASATYQVEDHFVLLRTILATESSQAATKEGQAAGVLAQAQMKHLAAKPLTSYLIDLEAVAIEEASESRAGDDATLSRSQHEEITRFAQRAVQDELHSVLKSDAFVLEAKNQKMSGLAVQSLTILCCVGFWLVSAVESLHSQRLSSMLRDMAQKLHQIICHQEHPSKLRGMMVSAISPALPSVADVTLGIGCGARAALLTTQALDSNFWSPSKIFMEDEPDDIGMIDVEEEFDSQISTQRSSPSEMNQRRDWLSGEVGEASVSTRLLWKVYLYSLAGHSASQGARLFSTIPEAVLVELKKSSGRDLIACRPLLVDLVSSEAGLDASFVVTILGLLGGKIFEPYEFNRSEAGLGTAVNILTATTRLWSRAEGKLVGLCKQLYGWFISAPLQPKNSSPHVLIGIGELLRRVIEVESVALQDNGQPSARTCLFTLLTEGSAAVRFSIGSRVSSIFGRFLLKHHDHVLDDIMESLHLDPSWPEGTAVRLHILSDLGARWSTLLRKAIYAMFEAPALMPKCSSYARICLARLSSRLNLENPRALFRLFVPQLIYTWLGTKPLRAIPYHAFGYSSLTELLEDVQDEVVAQVAMRGRESEANDISHLIGRPFAYLLEQSFGKCAAYCIARDAAVDPSEDPVAAEAAVRLRRLVGKTRDTQLLTERFPEIMGVFFTSLDRENSIGKSFQRSKSYATAQTAFAEIVASGSSSSELSVSQQPSFKSTCLLDEIQYICGRTRFVAEDVWTPALYTYVFRQIANTIHPALGELHTCSAIRRVRILISMAGNTPLSDYPLRMSLNCLRQYLPLTQCAEDVMSIFQFLLTHGSNSLVEDPGFVLGLLVSTLATLKAFLGLPQDSTTQESEYRAMMSRAQNFHAWLSSFASNYHSPGLHQSGNAFFRRITTAACELRGHGNATTGTAESRLLLALLDDQLSGHDLVNPAARHQILSQLYADFELPRTYREDILGGNQLSMKYASVVWSSYKSQPGNQNLGLWVGRILGRAYAGCGYTDPQLLRETGRGMKQDKHIASTDYPGANSRSMILQKLCDILIMDDQAYVGLAEDALRRIINAAQTDDVLRGSVDELPQSLTASLVWRPFHPPEVTFDSERTRWKLPTMMDFEESQSEKAWIIRVCSWLLRQCHSDAVLSSLFPIVRSIESSATELFPYILHLALLIDHEHGNVKDEISRHISDVFNHFKGTKHHTIKRLIDSILYLRAQPLPHEHTKTDRCTWLDLDFKLAADVALGCDMVKTALLFLELDDSIRTRTKRSRRSTGSAHHVPTELLDQIFRRLDDKDWFYGLQLPADLPAVLTHLEFQNPSFKRLSFQSAYLDSRIRYLGHPEWPSQTGVVDVLNDLELNGLSKAIFADLNGPDAKTSDVIFQTARKLEQWDLASQTERPTESMTLFQCFQRIHDSSDPGAVRSILDTGYHATLQQLGQEMLVIPDTHRLLETLAVLTETEEVLSIRNASELQEALESLRSRDQWMQGQRAEFVATIDSSRRTLFSIITKNAHLRSMMGISRREAREAEVRVLLSSSELNRGHGALQGSLNNAMYLTQLVAPSVDLGLVFDVAVRSEAANVLWDQGELSSSINMLQNIMETASFRSQSIPVGRAEILGKLGHRVSEARREKPEEIMQNYLMPAIKELKGETQGLEAGQVFHQFAAFCDQQLQNSDSREDFRRVEIMRQRKEDEVRELERMVQSSTSRRDAEQYKITRNKAQKWLDLDNHEFFKLKANRTALLCQALENYLLCLQACDSFDNDALRFSALWLEHHEDDAANDSVSKTIGQVASRKFALLMNQWTSRLLDTSAKFQKLLSDLVVRICVDHPYHGMYHVFTNKSKSARDPPAVSRQAAFEKVIHRLKKSGKNTATTWIHVHNSCVQYVRFASEPIEEGRTKHNNRIALRSVVSGVKLVQEAQTHPLPPPTIAIPLRPDRDYSNVPAIQSYHDDFSVAAGISAPKILTAVTSDGRKHRQLFKSGNDDLRQDAIMEQVFEQVNSLLRTHQQARQRNLAIRTYKVLPLTSQAGVIEFVPHTTALNDFLVKAHEKYFPHDLKSSNCRKMIQDAQSKRNDERIRVFRHICDKFHPVLRYFFMEKFESPDDWFEKRLAYTRSTAAISILGHVLGLGDRHGHNILLDDKSGEVVHIDLGIAFEQGRVLPVPELVPFRLTRDVVDGMGITKTEGVFRRCCEFTLDALRKESYTIMTILDVLRYDPLYNWSVSPLRLKKLQANQMEAKEQPEITETDRAVARQERRDEEGEADRALTVVTKKLSKSLSVEAAVNELIQQAMDDKNLALLFAGWAAYA